MKVMLAKKGGMTSYFDENGEAHAVTILTNAAMTVLELKDKNKYGYPAIVVGYGTQKAHRINRPQTKQYNGLFQKVIEFRAGNANEDLSAFSVGQTLDVSQFVAGDVVAVSGTSKGKGFQGVVKRHGFKGKGPIHNVHHALREPGSIGGGGRAGGRVVKGMKMAGRMGADRITVKNLKVVAVDQNTNTMLVKGAVPGNKDGLIEIVQN
jgi:large subunit ribosomal protein L3